MFSLLTCCVRVVKNIQSKKIMCLQSVYTESRVSNKIGFLAFLYCNIY